MSSGTTSSRGSTGSGSGRASGSGRCSITLALSALGLPRLRHGFHPHEGSRRIPASRRSNLPLSGVPLTLRRRYRQTQKAAFGPRRDRKGVVKKMCGIAGYSLTASSGVERTLVAQALLAGIAERGADAVGYAHRRGAGPVTIHKRRSGASALLEDVAVPAATTETLIHV